MISKNMIKQVRALEMKKNRKRERLFVAEGPKVVGDMLGHYALHALLATHEWHSTHPAASGSLGTTRWTAHNWGSLTVSDDELGRVSFLQHPQQVLAVFGLPDEGQLAEVNPLSSLCLALDGVQDPGNLGTIIRVADWFGIGHILCSPDTADAYNPKVVQATMGSLSKVGVHYLDLEQYLSSLPPSANVYGTLLDGTDIYSSDLSPQGIIVMGNEGNGISAAIRQRVNKRLLIPDFNARKSAESLNVAIATAIVCSEFRRR